jgi:hypothetical protein
VHFGFAPSNGRQCIANCGKPAPPNDSRNPNLPNCYKLAAGTVASDLFPFIPGPFTSFEVAKQTAAAAGVMQTNRALSYWMSQGLRYPAKSSVFRGIMKTAGTFAELSGAMEVIALDASLAHAIYVELTVPCQVP